MMLGSLLAQGVAIDDVVEQITLFCRTQYNKEIAKSDISDWILEWRSLLVLYGVKIMGLETPLEVKKEAPVSFLHLETPSDTEELLPLMDFLEEHMSDTMILVTKPGEKISIRELSDDDLSSMGLIRV